MTLEKLIEDHYTEARQLIDATPLERATWDAERAALQKLQEVREAAVWLARNLTDLVAKIDAEGLAYPIHAGAATGNLATRVDLAAAECAGLKVQIATLKRLANGTE